MSLPISGALRRYFEPALFGVVALGAVGAAGALVAYDLAHSPARDYQVRAAAAAPQAAPPVPSAPAHDQSVASVETAVKSRGAMSDVTLFERVPVQFDNDREYGVVTALVYESSNSLKPRKEYCYLQAGNLSAAAQVTVSLASKDGIDSAIEIAKIGATDAKTVGLPLKRLQESVSSCHFV
jgi:hypothetical protein